MPRRPRTHFASALYHVILRGNNRQDVFPGDADYLLWESLLVESIHRYDARIHCYCWMSNHVHFVAQVGEAPLGAVVRYTAAQYSRKVNSRLERTGHLFERRHRAILVMNDRYLMGLVRYIHSNPVRAGIVGSVDAYRWSSHAVYAGRRVSNWLTTESVLKTFGETQAAARSAYLDFMEVDVDDWPTYDDGVPVVATCANGEVGMAASGLDSCNIDERPAKSLDDIIGGYLEKTGLTEAQLIGPSRARSIAAVRTEIAAAAIDAGVANIASIARRLNRSESAISQALTLRRNAPHRRQ
jgi:REP element-mobilizing transposase RayT